MVRLDIVCPRDPFGDDEGVKIPFPFVQDNDTCGLFICFGCVEGIDPEALQGFVETLCQHKNGQDVSAEEIQGDRLPPDVLDQLSEATGECINWGFRFTLPIECFYLHPSRLAIRTQDKTLGEKIILWHPRQEQMHYGPTVHISDPMFQATVTRTFTCSGTVDPSTATPSASISNPGVDPATGKPFAAITGTLVSYVQGSFMFQFVVPNNWGDNTQWSAVTVQATDAGGYTGAASVPIKFTLQGPASTS